jgi:Lysyl oxidase
VRRQGLELAIREGLTLACLALLSAAPIARADSQATLRYPDLQTLAPSELQLDTTGFGRHTRHILRFTNTVVNAGAGPLELHSDPANGQLVQRIYDDAGGSVDEPVPLGQFIYFPDHGHWHFTDFAQYELQRVHPANDGQRHHHPGKHRHARRSIQKRRSKTSFCIRDTNPDPELDLPETPPDPVYTTCEEEMQGLSVGWGDTYRFNIPDQWIDLGKRRLPDGQYVLRSVADPRNLLDEGGNDGEASNAAQTCFTIAKSQLKVTAC